MNLFICRKKNYFEIQNFRQFESAINFTSQIADQMNGKQAFVHCFL